MMTSGQEGGKWGNAADMIDFIKASCINLPMLPIIFDFSTTGEVLLMGPFFYKSWHRAYTGELTFSLTAFFLTLS
jgi:hypothetical protein